MFKRMMTGLAIACCASMASATDLHGPMFPPPGGVTFTGSGDQARVGGLTFSFSNHSPIDLNYGLYYGRDNGVPIWLSMDGPTASGAEYMVFAGMAGNQASWTGTSTIRIAGPTGYIPVSVPTRFTLTTSTLGGATPIPWMSPVLAGVPASADAVIHVIGDFQAVLLFEAYYNGTWTPASDLFDSLNTDPLTQVATNAQTGYYAFVCMCELDGVMGVDVFDLLLYLNGWFAGSIVADLSDDVGGGAPDGDVDVFDLLYFLDCWFPSSMTGVCP